jgi:transporter family-2 protein
MTASTFYRFAPALLGVFVVLQAGLNRRMAQAWGLPAAVFLNAAVFAALAAGLFFYCQSQGEALPEPFRLRSETKALAVWFLVPGICGFLLVVGAPWSLSRFGAVQTFTLLISAQLATSLFWDRLVEGIAISPMRAIGVAVTWIGVLLAVRG